jgi:catechol 2,3-dioxygenase
MTPSLQLTAVTLRVPDLRRSVDFYSNQLGFVLAHQSAGEVELATSSDAAPILTLVERRGVPHGPRDTAGLFHVALLFADRPTLGGWLRFAAAQGIDFEGFSDHGVSEAIYLSDPDGNGLEFYADRPREAWPFANGELAMVTRPLALRSLLAAAQAPSDEPLAGATWGHLHLRVTNLERSEEFYCDHLGLEVMQRSYPGARFLAADGYHHHLGLNTWGNPRHAQPPGALGLAEATFARNGAVSEAHLADPDGIRLRVVPSLVAVPSV